ncbi:MAG: hypothetical protein ACUVWP_01170 [bacterium]
MTKIIVVLFILIFILFDLSYAIIGFGISMTKPMGEWSRDRFYGGSAYIFSGNFGSGRFVVVAPDIGYAMLGEDKLAQRYLKKLGYSDDEVENITSSVWFFGGGVKIRFSKNPYMTPYFMGLFEFYRRGIGYGNLTVPEWLNFGGIIYHYGPCIGIGVEVLPGKPVTVVGGMRWFYAKGIGVTEIEKQYLHVNEMDAQFLVFSLGVDFF